MGHGGGPSGRTGSPPSSAGKALSAVILGISPTEQLALWSSRFCDIVAYRANAVYHTCYARGKHETEGTHRERVRFSGPRFAPEGSPMTHNPHEGTGAALALSPHGDELRERFDREWKNGRQPRIEDYLQAMPEPERSDLLRELLLLELAHRRQSGEAPRAE